ncbi:acylneuraminate cytidylyltransferase [Demequina sp. SYSU T00192]|uniref:N-acylneuraminate cytidylyltransferase n=1 Tax=Demequina litoralis TaxID=3051660 RepID=A0ABT8G7M4_9MICO|nr:acylneuraminate cytidylyltransferase [Demequina sp. SYSU T00192]MDN4475156.1 acylneuraminate cytidylyltransferase [Demequina sp. SYSU T00192]
MSAVAIIPARGGSKGVPGKNVARVGGVPLIGRAIRAALAAPSITAAYVSTDDAEIARVAREHGAIVIDRPAELASDTATSEDALLHAIGEIEAAAGLPDAVAFLQATSPFIDSPALERAAARVLRGDDDVVFSAFETYAFLWRRADAGAEGVNHDHSFRPRRQDREPHFQETGAFYVMRTQGFLERRFRFFGRVGIEEVPESSAVEIDTPAELAFARALAPATHEDAAAIDVDALVMDFDGVHTDDHVTVDQDGVESVRVSRADGMGIGRLRHAGVPMLILSKERNPVVAARARKLGVEVQHGVDAKAPALTAWCDAHGLDPARVAYVGNDVNDIECLDLVGWPVVVPEARPEVREHARLTLTAPGGSGALRELAEAILRGPRWSAPA